MKRRSAPKILLLLLAAAAAAGGAFLLLRPEPPTARSVVARAVERLRAGDVEESVRLADLAFRVFERSAEAAAFSACAHGAAGDLAAALPRLEIAAQRDLAAIEPALEAGLLARALSRTARNGPQLREVARRWLGEASARADAAAARTPGFGAEALAVACRIAAGEPAAALDRIDGLSASSADEAEQVPLLRAAALVARSDLDGARAALTGALDRAPTQRLAAALERVESWGARLAEPAFATGLRAWAGRDAETAAVALSRWLDDHPRDPVALSVLASALARLRRDGEFARRCEALALADATGLSRAYFRGCHLLALGDARGAVTALEVARSLAPRDPHVLRTLVTARLAEGRPAEALAASRGAEAPTAESEVLAAAALDAQGDTGAAEAALRRALELAPGDSVAADRLASLLVREGRADEAVAAVRAVLQSGPDVPALRVRLGASLLAAGAAEEAEATLRDAVRELPRTAAAHSWLGRALVARRSDREAELALTTALRLDPDDVASHLELLRVAQRRGRLDERIAELDRLVVLRPQSAVAHFARGAAALVADDPDVAERRLRTALGIEPGFALAANELAWLLAERRLRPEEALPWAETALRLLPRDPRVLDTAGWVRFLLRDAAGGEPLLARAREERPNDAALALRHARCLVALGRDADARDALRAARGADARIEGDPAYRTTALRVGERGER